MAVTVGLSLLIAIVLFGYLSSTGVLKNPAFEFGGAAAAFFCALWGLRRWYDDIEARRLKALAEDNKKRKESPRQVLGPMDRKAFGEEKVDRILAELRGLHAQYEIVLPLTDLLPTLRKLFVRNSFGERIEDCVAEDWPSRLRAVRLTDKVLHAYWPSVSKFGTEVQKTEYQSLIGEVRAFSHNLIGLYEHAFTLTEVDQLLSEADAFKNSLPSSLPRDRIDPQIKLRCNGHIETISKIWQSLGLPPTVGPNVPL